MEEDSQSGLEAAKTDGAVPLATHAGEDAPCVDELMDTGAIDDTDAQTAAMAAAWAGGPGGAGAADEKPSTPLVDCGTFDDDALFENARACVEQHLKESAARASATPAPVRPVALCMHVCTCALRTKLTLRRTGRATLPGNSSWSALDIAYQSD